MTEFLAERNIFNNEGIQFLIQTFQGMSSLETINLSKTIGKKYTQALNTLIKGLIQCKSLKSINILGNHGINEN